VYLFNTLARDGSAKNFRIAFAFALLVKAHRIALFSHPHFAFAFRIRIALFALFSHFRTFSTFLVDISRLMHKKVVKSARKLHKICKKVRKREKVRNANAMRKWNQNSHCIASHYCNKKKSHFRIFFASHSHRTTIADPSKMLSSFQLVSNCSRLEIKENFGQLNNCCLLFGINPPWRQSPSLASTENYQNMRIQTLFAPSQQSTCMLSARDRFGLLFARIGVALSYQPTGPHASPAF
jgi:hypothetical protein